MPPRPDLLARIAELHKQIEELEAENANLRGDTLPPQYFIIGQKLNIPRRLLCLIHSLVQFSFITNEGMTRYNTGGSEFYYRVQVYYLRKALAPLNIKILNRHGEGYYLLPADRKRLKHLFEEPTP